MKIRSTTSIASPGAAKAARKSSPGDADAFARLVDAELHAAPAEAASAIAPAASGEQQEGALPEGRRAMEEAIALLDDALHALQSGKGVDHATLQKIEQARADLRADLRAALPDDGADDAEAILAAESARIRQMERP